MVGFGSVTVDLDGREVRLDGAVEHLEPQAFDLLAYLLAHRGRVVSKEELLDEVWGDQFVSESALTTRIKEIRRAVGDDGRAQAVIKNVRGRGYRFVAELDGETPSTERTDVAGHRRLPSARPLVGRDDDIGRVVAGLASHRIVTIVGPGGVGKTSLAVAVAHREADRTGRPWVFVDLAAIRDPDAVVPATAQALDLPPTDEDALIHALAELEASVLFDNCEHLIDHVAAVVDELMAAGGGLHVLATSRERLGIADELVVLAEPLDPEAARQLFVERARQAQPGLELGDDDTARIAELVEALDRLPLAIEMAAGRLTAMGLADLESLLGDHLGSLRAADRNPADRHRTVSDLVSWSVSLLDDPQRQLLADLSVFSGLVTMDDIVGVVSADDADRLAIVDGLAELVDRSLVQMTVVDGAARYRLLETTKAHARTLEHSPELEQRHARWFAEVARGADADLRSAREATGNQRMHEVFAELRAAHAWGRAHDVELAAGLSVSLGMYAHTRLRSEPARWAETLFLSLADDHPLLPEVAAEIAAEATHAAQAMRGRIYGRLALQASDHRSLASARESLSDLATYNGNLDAGFEHSEAIIAIGREFDDLHVLTVGVASAALCLIYEGRTEEAIAMLDAEDLPPNTPPSGHGWFDYTRAEALIESDPDAAIELYSSAVDTAERVDSRFLLSVSRASLAAALARHGDTAGAISRFIEILDVFRRESNRGQAVTAMRNLVDLLVRLGRGFEAMTLLGAVTNDSVHATYGTEEELLDACRATVEKQLGVEEVERAFAEGQRLSVREALEFSIAVLGESNDPKG